MKYGLILYFILVSSNFIGQNDFETRYFTINATSLPEVETLTAFKIDFNTPKDFRVKSITEYNKVTTENYWQPVDMAAVASEQAKYINTNYNTNFLNQKFNTNAVLQYERDFSTKVENTVYQEQRGLFFVDNCPPYGICPRCAAFRGGRGF